MRGTLLAKAKDLYAVENASLSGYQRPGDRAAAHRASRSPSASPSATLLYRASRWLRGRTNRVLNVGLLAAASLSSSRSAWLAAAYLGARSDLLDARARGSATVEAAAQVGIAAQEAHADESLTLIDNTGDDGYQADYLAQAEGPRPGTGHAADRRVDGGQGHPGRPGGRGGGQRREGLVRRARHGLRSLDDNGKHPRGRRSALGARPGDAGRGVHPAVGRPAAAINSDQAVFNSTARSAASAYTGLEAVIVAAALLMAAACAWGLSRRLAEYR